MKSKTINTLNRILGEGVFSDNEINTGRQVELDIAKGFAILFMIWVHTAETFSSGTSVGYEIVENFLGGMYGHWNALREKNKCQRFCKARR